MLAVTAPWWLFSAQCGTELGASVGLSLLRHKAGGEGASKQCRELSSSLLDCYTEATLLCLNGLCL